MPVEKDPAKKAFAFAKSNGADQAEAYLILNKTFKVDVFDQQIESLDNLEYSGLSIRVIKNNKLGFAYTAELEDETIEEAVLAAIENSKEATVDANNCFAQASVQKAMPEPYLGSAVIKDKTDIAMRIEKAAREYDTRITKVEKISYQDSKYRTIIVNSNGVDINYEHATCAASAEVIATQNSLMETGSWIKVATKLSGINPEEIGITASKRAIQMLGAGPEKSGRAPIILTPYAASTILSVLFPAFSAEYARKGKSLFSNSLDNPVASVKLSIVDSGVLKDGIASVPYDDEGNPTNETYVIKDGYLRTFLHNCYSAKSSKKTPTGNAFRASYKGNPEITPTNLYIKPGIKTQDELINSVSKGFLVTSIMGAHTINPISGDFSIGFSGIFIDNGKLSNPVRGMTLAGNIMDIFNHVEDIANDIDFFPHGGAVGSPSILISNLSVSGK